jgi:AraC-like DNA-binding protein
MVSNRCKMAVKEVFKGLGLHFVVVDLGEVEIMEELSPEELGELSIALRATGLQLMDDKKAVLIEKIINIIVEMIHHTDDALKINYSTYISDKLNHTYAYLSSLFSEVKGITIQQFIIIHKIERAKELLLYDELNLTEISYSLHYSSVAHLSSQFKKITGLSPSEFKQLKDKKRNSLEDIGNDITNGSMNNTALNV